MPKGAIQISSMEEYFGHRKYGEDVTKKSG